MAFVLRWVLIVLLVGCSHSDEPEASGMGKSSADSAPPSMIYNQPNKEHAEETPKVDELVECPPLQSDEGLEQQVLEDGTVIVDLKGRYQQYQKHCPPTSTDSSEKDVGKKKVNKLVPTSPQNDVNKSP